MYDNSSRVIEVDIDEILPNRFQPRIQFDEEEILELSDSIKEHGVIQPIVVRTIGDKYEIIAGERRYKASVLAGKETVPVIVKNLNDKDSAEVALIENIQRKNLTPIEEALSYKKILDMGYLTQENLASKLGKSQPTVANKIRLLNLSDEVQEALLENKISERHARSLLKLSTSKQQNEMLNRIISERLTVRRTDEEIEKLNNNTSDESDDNSQKIIEKGEIDMNNNMFGMPNVPQTPQSTTPSFDIFGAGEQKIVESQPQMEVTPAETPQLPNFDIFGTDSNESQTMGSAPVAPEVPTMPTIGSAPVTPEVPAMPTIESAPVAPEVPAMPTIGSAPVAPEVPAMPTIGSAPVAPEVPAMPTIGSAPVAPEVPAMPTMGSAPVAPEVPAMPTIESAPVAPEVPAMPTIESAPVAPEVPAMPTIESEPVASEVPAMPTIESEPVAPEVPQTAPIIESPVNTDNLEMTQQSENLFSFGSNTIAQPEAPTLETTTIPEFKMPEPIIVTDYSKQYDPVMPQSLEPTAPTIDFKEVINIVRECSNKIEKYGFKIDVEEYDLASIYQVVFKIEK